MNTFRFKIKHQDKKINARLGVIHTPHGNIETPGFVPVGTQATVKSLTPEEIKDVGVELFFVNTYHMYLRPGIDVVAKAGGLHRFMGWGGPIMTDSGGFQVFSLGREKYSSTSSVIPAKAGIQLDQGIPARATLGRDDKKEENVEPTMVKISDDGVTFRSHWDGSEHEFTPEKSMEYQWQLGSDIHIAFDDCTPYGVTEKQAEKSLERTHRWSERSLEEHQRLAKRCHPAPALPAGRLDAGSSSKMNMDSCFRRNDNNQKYQALYGSIQGSIFKDLREKSAKFITSLDFDGYAIGGVSVGESKKEMRDVLDWVCPYLPDDKPRHLLGVGEIDDIFTLIEHGIDTFDCVQPTRLARMGFLYTKSKLKNQNSKIHLKNQKYCIDITKSKYNFDFNPIWDGCGCYTCAHFTRAYIHHLFKVRELLGYRLATIHNIFFINSLLREIRLAIKEGSLVALKKRWIGEVLN